MKWFKHMSDASDDEFIADLEDKFGLEGYARWWKMLEAIATQMDETDKCSVAYPMQKWLKILKAKRNKLSQFLVYCELQLKINTESTGNILEIECPKLLEIRDNHSKNLQATYKRLASEEVEVDTEVEEEEEKEQKLKPKALPALTIQDIHPLLNSIETHFKDFSPFAFIEKMFRKEGHVRPVEVWDRVFTRMYEDKDKITNPEGWALKVFGEEAGNVEERMNIQDHEERKLEESEFAIDLGGIGKGME